MSVTDPTDSASRAVSALPIVREPEPAVLPVRVRQMMRVVLARSLPMAMYQLNRAGRSGFVGTGLLFCAGIFLFTAVLPQYREISALRSEIRETQPRGAGDISPHVRLSRFLDNLPKRSELPKITGQIFKIAASAGVVLDRGKYELTPMHSGHLARFRMSFPIKGHYPGIRHFIDATLTAIPSAAVDGLRIERKAVGDESVDADLRFSIFVRNES